MLAIFISFFADYIVHILLDEKYYNVYIFTIFGIWMEFFRMTSNLFGNISQSEMNTRKFILPYVIGGVITIILVYSSTVNDYTFYLPIALLIGSFFTMLIMYFSMQKLLKFKINFQLLFLSLLLSSIYSVSLFLEESLTLFSSVIIVGLFGSYFLGTIYFIYKKGLSYGYY